MTATPGDRQVSVSAPSSVTAGQPARVTVPLNAGGNQVLHAVRLALQLPQGWTAKADGPAVFGTVMRENGATVTVTPAS